MSNNRLLKTSLGPIADIMNNSWLADVQKTSSLFKSMNSFSDFAKSFSKTQKFASSFGDAKFLKSLAGVGSVGNAITNPKTFAEWALIFQNQNRITAAIGPLTAALGPLNLASPFPTAFSNGLAEGVFRSKMLGMQAAITGVNRQVASDFVKGINFDFLKSISEATDKAAKITEEITRKKFATIDDLRNLQESVEQSIQAMGESVCKEIRKTGKSPLAIISFILSVLSFILYFFPLHNENQNDAVTKEQFDEFKQSLKSQLRDTIDKITFQAIVRLNCNLRLKPNSKSALVYRLKEGSTVNILDSAHKWVHVSILDPIDGLPITGWVYKKYLLK